MTTVFDAGGEGSAKACWALMRRARADRFWSAPRDAKRPAISVVEIGYVRRSESSTETVESDACSAYETLIARLSCDRTSTSRMFSHSICKPSSRHYLAETGTAGLECATATSGRSFTGIANGSRRPFAFIWTAEQHDPISCVSTLASTRSMHP